MKRILKAGSKGFTLLEILIVIVILAVLAGLAVPIYAASVEKARAQEAIQGLETVRAGMLRYFQMNNTYVGATIRGAGAALAGTDIDADPMNPLGGQNRFFDYGVAPAAGTFVATATRIAGTVNGIGGAAVGSTITLDEAGRVTRNGFYV